MKQSVRRLAVLALALLLAFFIGRRLWSGADYRRGAEDYATARRTVGLTQDSGPVQKPGPADRDPFAAELAAVDLDALRAVNPDVLGWIAIPETELSYPLLQAEDNQQYLNRTWTGERSAMGSIFLECTCSPDFDDYHTILYGHRMNNQSMFGILHNYREPDFWREHPAVYLVDDAAVRRYEVFAAGEAGVQDVVYRLDIEESALEQELIDYCLEHSVIDTGVVPTAEDPLLTLSTCTGRGYATRWVVQAVLREEFPLERAS